MQILEQIRQIASHLTGKPARPKPVVAARAPRPVRYAATGATVRGDASYRAVWTSPASGIAYYVKTVRTAALARLPSDPPLHRRIINKGEPDSFLVVGLRDGQIVTDLPPDDLPALNIRLSLGGGLPLAGDRPRHRDPE
jgi:hypothetical protein